MYSVAFAVKDKKNYYSNHREKYHLDKEDAVLEEIPKDSTDKMPYYYWDGSLMRQLIIKIRMRKQLRQQKWKKSRRKKQRLRYRRKISLMR